MNGRAFYPVFWHSPQEADEARGVTFRVFDKDDEPVAEVDLVLPRQDVAATVARYILRWPQSAPAWEAEGSIASTREGFLLSSVEIRPAVADDRRFEFEADEIPAHGVTAVLRRLPLSLVLDAMHALLSWEERRHDVLWAELASTLERETELTSSVRLVEGVTGTTGRRHGRKPIAQARLRAIALAWLEEAARPGAHRRMAERFDCPESTIRDHIHAARKHEWLAPVLQGRRGAAPGPRLLAEASERKGKSR